MKRYFLLLFFFFIVNGNAQNFISFQWQISRNVNFQNTENQTLKWDKVDLLTSWERQGFSGFDGNCILKNNFDIPKKYWSKKLFLNCDLKGDVHQILINNQSFVAKNGTFEIPKKLLKEKNNVIVIKVSNLNYTGGINNNFCKIVPEIEDKESFVKIEELPENHIFKKYPKNLKISYFSPKNAQLEIEIIDDFHKNILTKNLNLKTGKHQISINLNSKNFKSGFYQIKSIMKNDGYIADVQWIGINPENIQCTSNSKPIGFKEFWQNSIQELSKISPNFNLIKNEELSKGTKDVYILEMKSFNNLIIRGYYFVPKNKKGKLPAILHVPGYGYGFENLDEFLNNPENVIELALCVRGHGISKDNFDPNKTGPGIWGYKIFNKDENSYRGIYMDCVRAVEFLWNRDEVDKSKIGVMGGSQGGGLAIATAALCKDKISACAYFDPFPTDVDDFVELRTICKTEIKNFLKFYNNDYSWNQAIEVQKLINVENFADEISCPVFFITALLDDDCPSHVGFSVYNKIRSKKEYKVFPNDGHICDEKYNKDFMNYFKNRFNF